MTRGLVLGSGLIAAYLLGAVPFGYLIARMRGIDIRTVGSGNTGATNVFRCVGKIWGLLTFFLDAAKGYAAATLLPWMCRGLQPELAGWPAEGALPVVLAAAAVVGHNWPVYLRFKGGKGVATSAGVLLGIAPLAVSLGLLVWVLVFLLGRYVSLASICAALAIAFLPWVLQGGSRFVSVALTLLAAMTIWRHRSNLVRLCNGTENRFDLRRKKKEST